MVKFQVGDKQSRAGDGGGGGGGEGGGREGGGGLVMGVVVMLVCCRHWCRGGAWRRLWDEREGGREKRSGLLNTYCS